MNGRSSEFGLVSRGGVAASGCATVLKVLADDTRLAVLRILLSGPRRVGEIHAQLDVEQSLLSHHLRVLREAGLVTKTRDGKHIRYELAATVQSRRSGEAIELGCCNISFS